MKRPQEEKASGLNLEGWYELTRQNRGEKGVCAKTGRQGEPDFAGGGTWLELGVNMGDTVTEAHR